MRAILVICLLLTVGLAGCQDTAPPNPTPSLRATVELQVKAFYDGDADTLRTVMLEDWFDFGSCKFFNSTEAVEEMRVFLESDEHKREMAQYDSYRDLVAWDEAVRKTVASDHHVERCPTAPVKPGDVTYGVPATYGSTLEEGWWGVYRLQDNKWFQVGGD